MKKEFVMLSPGTKVKMTKGYRGMEGTILEKTKSPFDFYVVRLENDIHIVVGPSAFDVEETAV